MKGRIVVLALAVVLSTGSALAQTFDEVIDPLESAISDLQTAVDDVESARLSAEDPGTAVRAIREGRRVMRSTAISLLLDSMDPKRRPKEYQQTMDALRILEPRVFSDPKRANLEVR